LFFEKLRERKIFVDFVERKFRGECFEKKRKWQINFELCSFARAVLFITARIITIETRTNIAASHLEMLRSK
jgi:hypothetical protein